MNSYILFIEPRFGIEDVMVYSPGDMIEVFSDAERADLAEGRMVFNGESICIDMKVTARIALQAEMDG